MNELQLVKSEHFGEIEADIYSDGGEMYMTINQLAECLEYAGRDAIEKIMDRNPYLKNSEFSVTDKLSATDGKRYSTRIFTEDGIYEVTMLSSQPKAKEFRAWIRKVLKALRRGKFKATGLTEYQRESLRIKQENTNVRKAATLERLAAKCPVDTYKLVLQSKAAELVTGEMLIPLPKVERPTFTAEQVGDQIGCSAAMVGRLANASGLKTPEYGQEVWDKARHSSKQVPSWKYYEEAIPVLQQKLDEHLEGKKGQ